MPRLDRCQVDISHTHGSRDVAERYPGGRIVLTGVNTAGLLAAIGLMWESDKNSVRTGLTAMKGLVPQTDAMRQKKAS